LPTYVRPEFTAAPIGIHGRLSVANRVQERERGLGCVAPILGAANSRDEERHHLVADQLVDDRVMLGKRFGRGMLEAVERGGKSLRAKLLAQRRGTSHVGEEHRDIHLRPANQELVPCAVVIGHCFGLGGHVFSASRSEQTARVRPDETVK
jgi:hypothetical protein